MKTNHTVKSYLKKFDILDVVPVSLQLSATLINLLRNESLVLQESSLSGIFFLVEGVIQVEHYDVDGGSVVLTISKPLSVIGDLEFFCSDCNNKTLSSVKCLEYSTVIFFPSADLFSSGFNDPQFLLFMCQNLAKKVYNTSHANILAPLNTIKKLERYLDSQSNLYGNTFKLIKRDDLASILGVSVRQLSRALKYLVSSGVITLHNKIITIEKPMGFNQF